MSDNPADDGTYTPQLPEEPELPVNNPVYDEDGNAVANPTNPTEEPYEGDPDDLVPPEESEGLPIPDVP